MHETCNNCNNWHPPCMYALGLLPMKMVPTCWGHTLFKLHTIAVPLLADEPLPTVCSGAEHVGISL